MCSHCSIIRRTSGILSLNFWFNFWLKRLNKCKPNIFKDEKMPSQKETKIWLDNVDRLTVAVHCSEFEYVVCVRCWGLCWNAHTTTTTYHCDLWIGFTWFSTNCPLLFVLSPLVCSHLDKHIFYLYRFDNDVVKLFGFVVNGCLKIQFDDRFDIALPCITQTMTHLNLPHFEYLPTFYIAKESYGLRKLLEIVLDLFPRVSVLHKESSILTTTCSASLHSYGNFLFLLFIQ